MVTGMQQIDFHEYRSVEDGVHEGYFVSIRQELNGSLTVLDRSSWDTCWYPVEESEKLRIIREKLGGN